MKSLRRILIALAAPAALLIGLTQLGGTPLFKGYDTGFGYAIESTSTPRLALQTGTGDLTCWVRLKLPATSDPTFANLSTNAPLSFYRESVEGSDQWVAIVAEGQKPEEKFKWPSGTTLFLSMKNGSNVKVNDWRIFLSDQGFDSQGRATGRKIAFGASLLLLALALVGGAFEAYAKLSEPSVTFTHEACLKQLIESIEGDSKLETKWMHSTLTKVLLEGVKANDAVAPLPLKNFSQKRGFWFRTRNRFRDKLDWIIAELTGDRNELEL